MFYSLFHLHIVHVFGFYCVRVWRERVCIFDVRTIACLHGSTVCLTQVPFLSQGRQGKRGRGVGEGREGKKMSHRACLGVITGYNYRICRHKPDYLKILPPPPPPPPPTPPPSPLPFAQTNLHSLQHTIIIRTCTTHYTDTRAHGTFSFRFHL